MHLCPQANSWNLAPKGATMASGGFPYTGCSLNEGEKCSEDSLWAVEERSPSKDLKYS